MNPLLIADVRAATLKEVQEVFETKHLQAEAQVLRHDGGATVLKTAMDRVNGIHKVLDSMREKELGDMEAEDQIRAAKFAKHWLDQAVQMLEKLYANEEQSKVRAVGRVQGMQDTVKSLETMYTAVRARQEALRSAIENGDVEIEDGELVHTGEGRRTPGTRPGKSVAQQRREEEASTDTPPSETAPTENDAGAQKPVKPKGAPTKRSTTKKKTTKQKK